jgi:hypothetical protein
MSDGDSARDQLIAELNEIRRRVGGHESRLGWTAQLPAEGEPGHGTFRDKVETVTMKDDIPRAGTLCRILV